MRYLLQRVERASKRVARARVVGGVPAAAAAIERGVGARELPHRKVRPADLRREVVGALVQRVRGRLAALALKPVGERGLQTPPPSAPRAERREGGKGARGGRRARLEGERRRGGARHSSDRDPAVGSRRTPTALSGVARCARSRRNHMHRRRRRRRRGRGVAPRGGGARRCHLCRLFLSRWSGGRRSIAATAMAVERRRRGRPTDRPTDATCRDAPRRAAPRRDRPFWATAGCPATRRDATRRDATDHPTDSTTDYTIGAARRDPRRDATFLWATIRSTRRDATRRDATRRNTRT